MRSTPLFLFALLTMAGSTALTATVDPPPRKHGTVSIKDSGIGAVCDGKTDDQGALQRAFAGRGTIIIPVGASCLHSSILQVSSNTSIICEERATLIGTDTAKVAIQFWGASNSNIIGCKLTFPNLTQRQTTHDAVAVLFESSDHITASRLNIIGSNVYFLNRNSNHITVTNNQGASSKSNGTLTEDGSHDILFLGNQFQNSGDTDFECVTHQNEIQVSNFYVVSNSSIGAKGLGASSVGCKQTYFIGNSIRDSGAHGLGCFTDRFSQGNLPSDCNIINNVVSNADRGKTLSQWGIYLYGVTGATIEGNTIENGPGIIVTEDLPQSYVSIHSNRLHNITERHGISLPGNASFVDLSYNSVDTVVQGSCISTSDEHAPVTHLNLSHNNCSNITVGDSVHAVFDIVGAQVDTADANTVGQFSKAKGPIRTPGTHSKSPIRIGSQTDRNSSPND